MMNSQQTPVFNVVRSIVAQTRIPHDDRRSFPRMEAQGIIAGKRLSPRAASSGVPLVSMELRDISVSGVSGWADTPMEKGERLELVFPPEGRHHGFNTRGKVVRCEASALGYRVAIQFDKHLMDD